VTKSEIIGHSEVGGRAEKLRFFRLPLQALAPVTTCGTDDRDPDPLLAGRPNRGDPVAVDNRVDGPASDVRRSMPVFRGGSRELPVASWLPCGGGDPPEYGKRGGSE
jgi:hypothetical protein